MSVQFTPPHYLKINSTWLLTRQQTKSAGSQNDAQRLVTASVRTGVLEQNPSFRQSCTSSDGLTRRDRFLKPVTSDKAAPQHSLKYSIYAMLFLLLAFNGNQINAQTKPSLLTSFTGLSNGTYYNASGTNAGNATPYTVSNIASSGWDFTISAGGNINASTLSSKGTNTGFKGALGNNDPFIRTSRASLTNTLTSVSLKANDASSFKLNYVYAEMSSATAGQTITLTGYKSGVVVTGATATSTTLANFVWFKFDVSSNTSFQNVDQISFVGTNNSGVMDIDEISISSPVLLRTQPPHLITVHHKPLPYVKMPQQRLLILY